MQLFQTHWASGVQLLSADRHLCAQPELTSVVEPRAGVDEDGRRIDLVDEPAPFALVAVVDHEVVDVDDVGEAAAAHQAVGVLLDDDGDDVYEGRIAANQGAAWDTAVAVLIDAGLQFGIVHVDDVVEVSTVADHNKRLLLDRPKQLEKPTVTGAVDFGNPDHHDGDAIAKGERLL